MVYSGNLVTFRKVGHKCNNEEISFASASSLIVFTVYFYSGNPTLGVINCTTLQTTGQG